MPYVVRVTVPGVARAMFSPPMTRPDAEAAERVLKRRHGFGVTIKPIPPQAHNARGGVLAAQLERAAARRRE